MPFPWIKIEWRLPDRIEVADIAQLCGITQDDALGKLVRLFIWYDQNFANATSLRLKRHQLVTVDRHIGCEKFTAALLACGWFRQLSTGPEADIEVVNFARHNSKTAKERALAADRTALWRERRERHIPVTITPSHTPAAPIVVSSTRNRVVDKSKKEVGVGVQGKGEPLELPDWLPVEAWIDFLAMRKQKGAKLSEAAQRLAISRLEKLRAQGHDPKAVLEQSTLGSWTGLYALKEDGKVAASASGFAHRDYQKGATPDEDIGWLRTDGDVGPAKT